MPQGPVCFSLSESFRCTILPGSSTSHPIPFSKQATNSFPPSKPTPSALIRSEYYKRNQERGLHGFRLITDVYPAPDTALGGGLIGVGSGSMEKCISPTRLSSACNATLISPVSSLPSNSTASG